MFEISFNLDSILSELDTLIEGLPSAVDQALEECGQTVAHEESKRTKGKLSESFYTYKDGKNQIIDSTKEYAQYIEFGRGPVTAVNAKALRFIIGGEVIFRKSVGPMQAQPFVHDSLMAAETLFTNIFDKHIQKLIK